MKNRTNLCPVWLKVTVMLTMLSAGIRPSAEAQTAMDIAPCMVPGWNLGNTLEAGPCGWLSNELDWETGWQPTRTTQRVIDYVKAAGFRSVRIPCAWQTHMDAHYRISPAWMRRVKEVVDYCIRDSLYVMLNDHWDNGWIEVDGFKNITEEGIIRKCEVLASMWTQIATTFADYDYHLLFAAMNEPNASDAATAAILKRYHQTFVDAVRATGGRNAERVLVVQAPSTDVDLGDSYNVLPDDPSPRRLMMEVHFYGPYNFVMMEEDADWGNRFFYWGKGNHVAGSAHNATWGEEDWMEGQMRKMYKKYSSKGFPVIIGEYGANWRVMPEGENQEKHDASLHDWYKAVTRYSISCGCVPMVWDTNGGHPVIDRAKLSIGNQLSYDGIMEGVKQGIWPFTSDIQDVRMTEEPTCGKAYNLLGIPITDSNCHGIVIQNGKKYYK